MKARYGGCFSTSPASCATARHPAMMAAGITSRCASRNRGEGGYMNQNATFKDIISGMLTIWRRHTESCPHRAKGRDYLKCNCPLWADGYLGGKRVLRQSLGTRDMARARKKAVALESPDNRIYKPVGDAVAAIPRTLQKRRSSGCDDQQIPQPAKQADRVLRGWSGLTASMKLKTETLDRFRAGRRIAQTRRSKELAAIRLFLGFCVDSQLGKGKIPAKKIKLPRLHQAQ